MSDEDDWFERAISRDEDESEEEASETESTADSEGFGDEEKFGEGDAFGGEESAFGGANGGEESPFDTDFGAAFESAPDPGTIGDQPEDSGPVDGQGFPGESPDFGGPGGPESFDEEEFESDLERLKIGIEGLDEMILGGVPERSLMVAIGSAGTGKTTFGMEFLRTALENGDNAVYISLEEGRDRILNTADEKGWEFSHYEQEEQLAIVNFDPVEMANTLSSIQNELPKLIEEFDADRVVLDSVSLLEMMYDHPSKRRSQVFDFTKSLKQAGVTTFVTSEASKDDPYNSRHGIIEYLADAVFVLQYVRPSDFQETRLAIEIQKIRDANHSRETKPYEITGEGISVYRQANIF